jgi:hypothetical protein
MLVVGCFPQPGGILAWAGQIRCLTLDQANNAQQMPIFVECSRGRVLPLIQMHPSYLSEGDFAREVIGQPVMQRAQRILTQHR